MSRIVIKGATERIHSHPPRDLAAPKAQAQAPSCETEVVVLRQDGVVTGLEVRCKCGETTVVEFDYPGNEA